ncbi:MAG: ATP-binding protein [Solirubrobacteraceae bacterium]
MALSRENILEQNPWWTSPESWEATDPHLVELAGQPRRLPADLVERLDVSQRGIHTIRGPRQVGKTTDLKLIVRNAVAAGRPGRSVIYLSLDLLAGQPIAELESTVREAKRLADFDGPSVLLLDEITVVRDWQRAIKDLYERGALRGDAVVCTGSSAIDLRAGTEERLPGRRGSGEDHLVLPHDFANVARALNGTLPPSPRLTLAELVSDDGRAVLHDAELHLPALQASLATYLRFGGLPAAVAEAIGGAAEPSRSTKRVLYDALITEVRRRGASEPAFQGLLEQMVRSLSSKTNWSKIAREMGIPAGSRRGRPSPSPIHYNTVRDYVEFLAGNYWTLVVYFWKHDADANSLARDKKLYFPDPLLYVIARDQAPGLPADEPAQVENAVATALYRTYEDPADQVTTWSAPRSIHAWESGREIDFACGPRSAIEAVEVKYRRNPDLRTAAGVSRAFPGRPVVLATRDLLAFRERYAAIPASMLLWALRSGA